MFIASRPVHFATAPFGSGMSFAPKGDLENQDRSRAINIAPNGDFIQTLVQYYFPRVKD